MSGTQHEPAHIRPTIRLADCWLRKCVAAELARGSGCLGNRTRKEGCLAQAIGDMIKASLPKVYYQGVDHSDTLTGPRSEKRVSGKVLQEF